MGTFWGRGKTRPGGQRGFLGSGQPARDSAPELVQGRQAPPLPPASLALPDLPPPGQGRNGTGLALILEELQLLSHPRPPSQHTKALSFPARGLDCVSPESESSYEGSASLPGRVCECVCSYALMHAHVPSLWELGPLGGQTLSLPPGFGLAHLNMNPLCVDACACVFVWVRVCV